MLAGGGTGAADAKRRCADGGGGGGVQRLGRRLRVRLLLLSAAWIGVGLLLLAAVLELETPKDDSGSGGGGGGGSRSRDGAGEGVGVHPTAGKAPSAATRGTGIPSSGASTPVCRLQLESDCKVVCSGGQSRELSTSLTELLSKNKACAGALRLHVQECQFPNKTVASGWLDIPGKLVELRLISSEIDSIADDAFNATQFAGLQKLFLEKLSLQNLQKAVFRPLEYLDELSITECSSLEWVEQGVAADLPHLGSLQVQNSVHSHNKRVLAAFAGSGRVAATIDLSYNSLGVLHPDDILAAVYASQLSLVGSEVTAIEAGTFPQSQGLVLLYLIDNKLETLTDGSIDFENHPHGLKLYLEKNQWNCNCSLLWLLEHSDYFGDIPVCSTPPQYSGIPLKDMYDRLNHSCFDYDTTTTVSDCETQDCETQETTETSVSPWSPTDGDITVSSTETSAMESSTEHTTETNDMQSSTEHSTMTTTENPIISGSADQTTLSLPTTTKSTTTTAPPSVTTEVPASDLQLCIHSNFSEHSLGGEWEINDGDDVHFRDVNEYTVRITLSLRYAGGYIAWKRANSIDCHETSPLSSPEVELNNLQPDANYQICVLRAEDTRTSIRNCHPHRTIPELRNRVWMPNSYKPSVLGGGSAFLVIITVVIFAGTLQLVHYKPKLLWKNVYFANETVLIVPQEPTFRSSVPPPTTDRRDTFQSPPPTPPQRPPLVSGASSTRTSTSSNSYITVKEPTQEERFIAERLGTTVEKLARILRRRDSLSGWRRWSLSSSVSTIAMSRRRSSVGTVSVNTVATSVPPADFSAHNNFNEDPVAGASSNVEIR